MTLIIALTLAFITGLLFAVGGFLAGFIIGFYKGFRLERPEVEALDDVITDTERAVKKPKLQVSLSKRETIEMKQLADDLPVPNIRKTLEERQRHSE